MRTRRRDPSIETSTAHRRETAPRRALGDGPTRLPRRPRRRTSYAARRGPATDFLDGRRGVEPEMHENIHKCLRKYRHMPQEISTHASRNPHVGNGILSLWKLINRIYVVLWGCGIVAQLGWIFASGYKTHDLGWIFVALIYNIIVWPFFFITWHVGREIDSPFDRSVAQVERNPPTIELALASAAPALIVVEAQPESAAGDADAGDADASDGNFQRALSASAAAADADAPADAALDAAPDAAPAAAAAVATQL
ncbi:hypothetical protein M885DRAFT_260991 [Pelagophyceae sp. CCMP2097]|nr:hypothetical protein M885DRAFT_260991 [Pelagophyceae sp. CCMP2097]